MNESPTPTQFPPLLCRGWFIVTVCALTWCGWFIFIFYSGDTLDSHSEKIGLSVLWGLFLSIPSFLLFGLPIIGLVFLIWRWRRWTAFSRAWLIYGLLIFLLAGSMVERDTKTDARGFESATGLAWPAASRCVLYRKGFGILDRRFLWLFEGEEEDWNKYLQLRSWSRCEDIKRWDAFTHFTPTDILDEFWGQGSSWAPIEVHRIYDPGDDDVPPEGPLAILVDSSRRRWCIWHGRGG